MIMGVISKQGESRKDIRGKREMENMGLVKPVNGCQLLTLAVNKHLLSCDICLTAL